MKTPRQSPLPPAAPRRTSSTSSDSGTSPLTNIVERVGTQGASYGSTNVLRTVTAFYSAQVGAAGSAARAGRIKSIRHEDGRLDLYDYALTEGLWTETVTHLHEQSPEPVSGKTTRDTTLTNRRSETRRFQIGERTAM